MSVIFTILQTEHWENNSGKVDGKYWKDGLKGEVSKMTQMRAPWHRFSKTKWLKTRVKLIRKIIERADYVCYRLWFFSSSMGYSLKIGRQKRKQGYYIFDVQKYVLGPILKPVC